MNDFPPGNGNERRRRFSWTYDEDHHIRQYSDENELLPIDEYGYEDNEESNVDHDHETNGEYGMELCDSVDADMNNIEIEHATDSIPQQPPHPRNNNHNNNTIGRRRRRTSRKTLGKGWEIPSASVMRRRHRFRQFVSEETRQHKRIIPTANNNMEINTTNNNASDSVVVNGTTLPASTTDSRTRNVLQLLRDREVFGGGSSNGGIRKTTWVRQGFRTDSNSQYRVGVRLTTVRSNDDGGDTTGQYRRQRRRTTSRTSPPQTTNFTHRPITDELRTFAEEACVTRFEASYLTHLQHDDQSQMTTVDSAGEDNSQSTDNTLSGTTNSNDGGNDSNANNQNASIQQLPANTSSNAVSTISIAFSPDGKTMASTHGDHTVKITCCLTGELLQTLIGHPRTPWTVKYHPHAGVNHKKSSMPPVVIANSSNSTNSSNSSISSSVSSLGRSRRSSGSGQQTAESEDASQAQHLRQQYGRRQQIVASGCLGHQVRIWDWISGTCLQMIRLEFAIISLSFHPSGSILAIANGTRLHFWSFPTVTEAKAAEIENGKTWNQGGPGENGRVNNSNSSRYITNPGKHMHIDMRHMLRCVHFLPDGKKVIVGGVNQRTANEFRRQQRLAAEGQQELPPMSFYLRLWDFDLEATRAPIPSPAERQQVRSQIRTVTPHGSFSSESGANGSTSIHSTSNTNNGIATQQQVISESTRAAASAAALSNNMAGMTTTRRRRFISNPRCFVPRALLYNDGGFDVSPDGKTLCACAEYWLPEGVDNATDLLHPPQDENDEDFVDDDSIGDCNRDEGNQSSREDSDDNTVEMDDAKGETIGKTIASKSDQNAIDVSNACEEIALSDAKGIDPWKKKSPEDLELNTGNSSAAISYVSPKPPQSSNGITRQHQPSATPPRTFERQPRQISSPPLTLGPSATGSSNYGFPIPPMQAGITPQTPPPNVNPLNFPLSPPSPPGRRFAGGLNRGAPTSSSQQHEQLLQQYNRQQAMLHQHRNNHHQQGTNSRSQQQLGSSSTQSSRGTRNTNATIPAPPGINHRNHQQQRQTSRSVFQKASNPFDSTSQKYSDDLDARKRGRFVPHVVTISLDTEPYVETIVEENINPGSTLVSTSIRQQHSGIRTTAAPPSSNIGGAYSTTTTTITKTTYNVPGRDAASTATKPHVNYRRPRLGQLLSACPLDPPKASAVTCVKFSPHTDFCLIGYGVRELHVEDENGNDPSAHPPYHPVTAMYKVNKGGVMRHVSTMLSGDDDVNIARFHPDSGYGFVYGTKQGRIRILGPRPWNYYNC